VSRVRDPDTHLRSLVLLLIIACLVGVVLALM
jgi:hypothetical protein